MSVTILEVQHLIARNSSARDYRSRIVEYESFEKYLNDLFHGYTGMPIPFKLNSRVINEEKKETSSIIYDMKEERFYTHFAKVIK